MIHLIKTPTSGGLYIKASADLGNCALDKGLDKAACYKVTREEDTIGSFTLAPLPGCCGVVVSIHTGLLWQYRGNGMSKYLHELKEAAAKELGYSLMISTTQCGNIPQVVGASKAGWCSKLVFVNKRTRNNLFLMTKEI